MIKEKVIKEIEKNWEELEPCKINLDFDLKFEGMMRTIDDQKKEYLQKSNQNIYILNGLFLFPI